MLTEDRAKEIIEDALKPLQCGFEPMNFDLELKFEVTNQDGERVYPPVGVPSRNWKSESSLRDEILAPMKREMEDKGYTFAS